MSEPNRRSVQAVHHPELGAEHPSDGTLPCADCQRKAHIIAAVIGLAGLAVIGLLGGLVAMAVHGDGGNLAALFVGVALSIPLMLLVESTWSANG